MILVCGTKRSGTSLWMQILKAAGLPIIGEAFPRRWRDKLGAANPRGFYESSLRHGIYYRTNPHPERGEFLFPDDTRWHAVKVFIPGLVRTDMAYIHRVIATVRRRRDQVASVRRLYALEDAALREHDPEARLPLRVPPSIEWWTEVYALLFDLTTRRHGAHVQSYEGLLARPERVIARTLEWLGRGELAPSVAVVEPALQTSGAPQTAAEAERLAALPDDDELAPPVAALADELYDVLHRGAALEPALLRAVNDAHVAMRPRITACYRAVREDIARRRARALDLLDRTGEGDDS